MSLNWYSWSMYKLVYHSRREAFLFTKLIELLTHAWPSLNDNQCKKFWIITPCYWPLDVTLFLSLEFQSTNVSCRSMSIHLASSIHSFKNRTWSYKVHIPTNPSTMNAAMHGIVRPMLFTRKIQFSTIYKSASNIWAQVWTFKRLKCGLCIFETL